MYLKQHIFFGFVFASVLFLLFPKISYIGFLIVFLSSVLIDFDHYIYYVYKNKNFNLKKAYNWFMQEDNNCRSLPWKQRNNLPGAICVFHGVEVLIILLFVSIIFNFFILVFVGFAFHLLLDSVEQTTYWNKMDKLSTIYDILKIKSN